MSHDAIVDDLKFVARDPKFNQSSIIKTINGDFIYKTCIDNRDFEILSYKYRLFLVKNDILNQHDLYKLNDNGEFALLKRAAFTAVSQMYIRTFPNYELVLIYDYKPLNKSRIIVYKLKMDNNEISFVEHFKRNIIVSCVFHLTHVLCVVSLDNIHIYDPTDNSWRVIVKSDFDNHLKTGISTLDYTIYKLVMEDYKKYINGFFRYHKIVAEGLVGTQFGPVIIKGSKYYQVNFNDESLTLLPKFYRDLYKNDEYIIPTSPIVKSLVLDSIINLLNVKDVAKLIMDYIFMDLRLFA